MTSSTTTIIQQGGIELQASTGLHQDTISLVRDPLSTNNGNPDWTTSTAVADSDNVVEASRIADANVPDGGYGWVIIFCACIITFWFVGIPYCWGVIQAALVSDGLASSSTLAFVGSLTTTCIAAAAILNGRLIRWLGARKVAFIGTTMMGLGQILSGFAKGNVGALFVTQGLIMGYGVSCSFMVCSVTPAQYFSKKRGLANGIVYAGGGVGGAVISLTMSAIVTNLGISWAFWLLGILVLVTGLPAAYFIKERAPIRNSTFVEWRLFRDMKFLVLFFAGMIATFPLFVPPFFLPLYARSLGFTPQLGAALLAGFNFSSAVGRVLCGLMGDKLGPVNSLLTSLLLSAISILALWPVSTTLVPLIIFVILNGMGNGGYFAIMPTVVGNVFGSARVSIVMGMIVTGWSGGYLMGAPIAGYLLDAYGGPNSGFQSYRPAILYAGAMSLGAAFLVAFVRFRMSKSPLKRL